MEPSALDLGVDERRVRAYSWSSDDSDKLAVLIHGFAIMGERFPTAH